MFSRQYICNCDKQHTHTHTHTQDIDDDLEEARWGTRTNQGSISATLNSLFLYPPPLSQPLSPSCTHACCDLLIKRYALPSLSLPYMHALYMCLIRICYMCASSICLICLMCMSCMFVALYVCLMCWYIVYGCLVYMPYMYASHAGMPWMPCCRDTAR